jgi:outer membrane immunogenic protein
MAGGQIGFDWQLSPNWVVGLEGQLSWVDFDQSWAAPGLALTRQNDWIGSITGRVGYTWGPGLLYVKGGWAFADNDYSLVVAGVPAVFSSGNNSNNGWTLGAGLEYMFAPSWSAKIEYQYYNFGSDTLIAPVAPFVVGVNTDNDVHTVKLGVNYRFNWGGPVAARY